MGNFVFDLNGVDKPLTLTINKNGGVSGESPTVAIRKPDTVPVQYLDFNDTTFKASGWTTRQLSLTEIDATNSPGVYEFLIVPSAISASPETLIAEFENTGVNALVVSDTVTFIDPVTDANVIQLSSDATAANNLLATFNGSGYTNDVAPAQQQQLAKIGTGGGIAANIPAVSGSVITSGNTITGDFSETSSPDSVYWQIEDAAGSLDMYFEFIIASDAVPVSVTHLGRVNSANDTLNVFAFNWNASSWDQVGTLPGQGSTTDITSQYILFTSHVGTGADLGKVRIRFSNSGLTNADFYTDQIFLSFTVFGRSAGYANGAIWLDTINGVAGTTQFVNGVADNPVDSLADAISLSALLGINRIQVSPGSTITFVQSLDNYVFLGENWTLALGNQSISSTVIMGANVTGSGTGANSPTFIDCSIGNITLQNHQFRDCAIEATATLSIAGDSIWDKCYSAIAGLSTPSIDFGASVGDTNISLRHYSGGIELKRMGVSGIDTMSLEGHGQYIINANCASGILVIRGHFKKTDNSGGAITITDAANFPDGILTDETPFAGADIATILSETVAISGFTDSLEAGQTSILANQATISGFTNTLESGQTTIIANTDTLEAGQTTIIANTDTLEAGQTIISGFTDTLESGQTNLIAGQSDIDQAIVDVSGSIPSGVWSFTDRTLTSVSGLEIMINGSGVEQIASGVWDFGSRILTGDFQLGDGAIIVDHNFGNTDALRVLDTDTSQPIDNALIQAFLKSDFDAGNNTGIFIKAQTRTKVDGRWFAPISLDPGVYTLLISKQSISLSKTVEITVT